MMLELQKGLTAVQNDLKVAKEESSAAKQEATEAKEEATAAKQKATAANQEATEAKQEATAANTNATVAKEEATAAKQEATNAKMETKSGREDARQLAASSSRTLINILFHSKFGFKSSHRAKSGSDMFVSALIGDVTWNKKVVKGSSKKILDLAHLYQGLLLEKQDKFPGSYETIPDIRAICCSWDAIKDARNNEQHEPDLSAALAGKIAFYARHIDLGDVLQAKDQAMYDLFKTFEKSYDLSSTVPAAAAMAR
jgi:hypothetical protein